jgi:hypothetical protein
MSDRATLQSIARSGHRKNFPLIRRAAARTPAASHSRLVMARLWYNHISAAGPMSVTLTNAEKQARYRERHLGVDGEKARVGLNLNAGTRAKMGRLARHRGYTITDRAFLFRWQRWCGQRRKFLLAVKGARFARTYG